MAKIDRWVWLLLWSLSILSSGFDVLAAPETPLMKWVVVWGCFLLYSCTLFVWLPRRRNTAALFRGTFWQFVIALLAISVLYRSWWEILAGCITLTLFYALFVAPRGPFQEASRASQDQTD